MTHIMKDLETWGKTPGSDIRSIGAVVFDPVAGTIAGSTIWSVDHFDPSQMFYVATEQTIYDVDDAPGIYNVDHFWYGDGYVKYPLTRDPETVQWWKDQSADAQAAFANPIDLHDACYSFGFWLGEVMGEATNMSDSPLRLWANDPHFDVSILDAVFRAVGLPVPWHYRAPRSMKTVCDLANITREDMAQFNHGTAHNALDDAISQAMIVCEAYKRLGLRQA